MKMEGVLTMMIVLTLSCHQAISKFKLQASKKQATATQNPLNSLRPTLMVHRIEIEIEFGTAISISISKSGPLWHRIERHF